MRAGPLSRPLRRLRLLCLKMLVIWRRLIVFLTSPVALPNRWTSCSSCLAVLSTKIVFLMMPREASGNAIAQGRFLGYVRLDVGSWMRRLIGTATSINITRGLGRTRENLSFLKGLGKMARGEVRGVTVARSAGRMGLLLRLAGLLSVRTLRHVLSNLLLLLLRLGRLLWVLHWLLWSVRRWIVSLRGGLVHRWYG